MGVKRLKWSKTVQTSRKVLDPLAGELRRQRSAAKAAAQAFVRACQSGDVAALYAAVDLITETTGGWTAAMRAVARQVHTVGPAIREAFLHVWIESKMLPFYVDDHRALCEATRVLLAKYQGPVLRLYRGAVASERRHRTYGVAWTTDIAVAENFARQRQEWDGGSVVLETLAPSEAIICAIDYPEPFTQEEIARLKRECPTAQITEFHEEREYVVDRRHLNAVTVVRRYAQLGPSETADQG